MRTKFNIPSMYFILLQYMQKTFVDLCIFIINIKYKKFYQYLWLDYFQCKNQFVQK